MRTSPLGEFVRLRKNEKLPELMLDEDYPQEKVKYNGTYYLAGRVGVHDVFTGAQRKMGLSGAADLAEYQAVSSCRYRWRRRLLCLNNEGELGLGHSVAQV